MGSHDSSSIITWDTEALCESGTGGPGEAPGCAPGLLGLSDEVLVQIVRYLEPACLLRLGSTCSVMLRLCSCHSLWSRHFQDSFGVCLPSAAGCAAKTAFRLVFMWRALFRNVHCNRALQEKLLSGAPFPPRPYWMQWLVLEEHVPLPAARLLPRDVARLWGVPRRLLDDKRADGSGEEDEALRFEWRELYGLARAHHGGVAALFQHVLHQHRDNDHSELASMYHQYSQCRFQWLFTFWLFRQPPPFARQIRSIFLQWRKHSKRKVAAWGGTLCDVRYLASLHPITGDYWRGRLARGDENVGIHTVGNYFSMCRSLMAWILGRDWGRLKRRKVYEDTLDGVYLLLKREMQEQLVEHERFWQVAKVLMSRVCALEETATNYVNWKLIETLPYYKLYLVSGNAVYLALVQGFLRRKRLLHNWIFLQENIWLKELLPDELYTLLEYDSKIAQGTLHGSSATAQLSRLIWLYLHSGEQLYMEGVKEMVLRFGHAHLALCPHTLAPDSWLQVLRPAAT